MDTGSKDESRRFALIPFPSPPPPPPPPPPSSSSRNDVIDLTGDPTTTTAEPLKTATAAAATTVPAATTSATATTAAAATTVPTGLDASDRESEYVVLKDCTNKPHKLSVSSLKFSPVLMATYEGLTVDEKKVSASHSLPVLPSVAFPRPVVEGIAAYLTKCDRLTPDSLIIHPSRLCKMRKKETWLDATSFRTCMVASGRPDWEMDLVESWGEKPGVPIGTATPTMDGRGSTTTTQQRMLIVDVHVAAHYFDIRPLMSAISLYLAFLHRACWAEACKAQEPNSTYARLIERLSTSSSDAKSDETAKTSPPTNAVAVTGSTAWILDTLHSS